MSLESRFTRASNSGSHQPDPLPPSHFDNNIHDYVRHPNELPFPRPSPLSHDQAIQDINGPRQAGLSPFPLPIHLPPASSRKRKRMTSPEPGAARVSRLPPDDAESDPMNMVPPPVVEFTGRKTTAYDIWPFTRVVHSAEDIPSNQWPDDDDQYLTKRPDSLYVGCKLCTQFG